METCPRGATERRVVPRWGVAPGKQWLSAQAGRAARSRVRPHPRERKAGARRHQDLCRRRINGLPPAAPAGSQAAPARVVEAEADPSAAPVAVADVGAAEVRGVAEEEEEARASPCSSLGR